MPEKGSPRNAGEVCEQKIGSLVEFESEGEEELLLDYLRGKYEDTFSFWIGLRDHKEENTFKWETSGKVVGDTLTQDFVYISTLYAFYITYLSPRLDFI